MAARGTATTGGLSTIGALIAAITISACNSAAGPSTTGQPTSVIPPAAATTGLPSAASLPPSESVAPTGGSPSGFAPSAVTFVSASDGWVLGTASCSTGSCIRVLQTGDGGRTWSETSAPPAPPSLGVGQPGVHSIRFANRLDGWVFWFGLWSTHDGGATWHEVHILGLPADSTAALETANGVVTALGFDGQGSVRIAASPVDRDAWELIRPAVDVGAGPVPNPILVLVGNAGWFLEVDRAVIGGARLAGGSWQTWKPPCLDANGPAVLAATTADDVDVVCDEGVWGPPPAGTPIGERLFVSHDGGRSFDPVSTPVPLHVAAAAMRNASELDLAGTLDGRAVIYATSDGGRTWRETFRGQSNEQFSYLGFTTPTHGVAIVTAENGGGRLLMTRDAGRSWTPVTF